MNILIPHHWLLDHLDTKATPQQIQKYLSLCGPSVERIHKVGSESVYDIEVTTNRVDMMSVRGIAREAATILPEFKIPAKLKPLVIPRVSPPPKSAQLPLPQVFDPDHLSRRITCIILQDVNRVKTPKWMAERLTQVGINVHEPIIDITNYVMHELGYTFHAFDYDQIIKLGGQIHVTLAKKGEKFTIIDGEKFTCVGGEIVFKNQKGQIIDLPAIKGTANTSVNDQTKNVLLWTENLDPKKVRFASMTHAIRTGAAVLAEKNLDPYQAYDYLERGVDLYQQLTHAKVASPIFDLFSQKPQIQTTVLTQDKLDTYLGISVPSKRVERILTNLGCTVETTKTTSPHNQLAVTSYQITPPSFRAHDLEIPQDYIEEVARIYGYHNLPSVIMPTPIPDTPPHEDFSKEHHLKELLSGFGLQEVYTYSMISAALALQSGHPLDQHLTIKNPLSDDWVYLRRTLIPSHLQVISQNKNHSQIAIFELANTYIPQKGKLPEEKIHLTITTSKDYRFLKGILDALSQKLFISNITIKPVTNQTPQPFLKNKTGKIYLGKQSLGHIGQVTSANPQIYALEIPLYSLLDNSSTHPKYIPVLTTSPIIEDLTFTLPAKTYIAPIIDAIQSAHQLISQVKLKTIYHQNYTFTITYQHQDKQLSVEDIAPIRKSVVKKLATTYKAKLVGELQA